MFARTAFLLVMVWACAEGLIVNRQALLVLDRMKNFSTSNADEWFTLPQFTYHDSFYGYEVTYTPRFRSLAGFDMYDNATMTFEGRMIYMHIPLNVRDLMTEYQVTCEGRETETFTQNVTISNLNQATIKINVTSTCDVCAGTLMDVNVGSARPSTTYGRPAPFTFCYRAVGHHLINSLTRHVRDSAKKFLSKAADLALDQLYLCEFGFTYDDATTSTEGRNLYMHIPLNVRDLVTEYQVTCEGRETETFTQNVTTSNLDQATIKISVTSSADACTGTLVDVDVGSVHSLTTYGRPAPLTFCYSAVGDHLVNALTRHFFGHVKDSAKKFLSKAAYQSLEQLNLC